jgi:hypothetical protein
MLGCRQVFGTRGWSFVSVSTALQCVRQREARRDPSSLPMTKYVWHSCRTERKSADIVRGQAHVALKKEDLLGKSRAKERVTLYLNSRKFNVRELAKLLEIFSEEAPEYVLATVSWRFNIPSFWKPNLSKTLAE